jgi:hypothetical protein
VKDFFENSPEIHFRVTDNLPKKVPAGTTGKNMDKYLFPAHSQLRILLVCEVILSQAG